MAAEQQLRALIERILRLKEEQDTLAADIREVYAEAKAGGFDKTAMGQLVAHLRKVEKVGVAAVEEGQTVFDTYLDAYRRATGTGVATHTHEANQSYAEVKGIDRVTRRKQRTSEAMDDAKALSAEAAALGLIDPEAHAETARIADAVARKYGAGVIDPETGEITEHEQPEIPANEIHERPSTNDKAYLEAVPQDEASLAGTGSRMLADREGRSEGEAASADLPTNSNPQPTSSPEADKTETVFSRSVSVALSDDDVPTFLKKDKPRKTAADYRPHCQHPEACGSSGLHHCYQCQKAIASEAVPA